MVQSRNLTDIIGLLLRYPELVRIEVDLATDDLRLVILYEGDANELLAKKLRDKVLEAKTVVCRLSRLAAIGHEDQFVNMGKYTQYTLFLKLSQLSAAFLMVFIENMLACDLPFVRSGRKISSDIEYRELKKNLELRGDSASFVAFRDQGRLAIFDRQTLTKEI